MITQEINDIVKEYALAHLDAHDNPKKLLAARSAEACRKVSDECAERMRRCAAADKALLNLRGEKDLPGPVQNFLDADADRGCSGCWLSSAVPTPHHECHNKIRRWFFSRTRLIEYGTQLILMEMDYGRVGNRFSVMEDVDSRSGIGDDPPPSN